MTYKYQQPAFLVDDITGQPGLKNPATGADMPLINPLASPSITMAPLTVITESAAAGITAFAGGGQTNATPLTSQTNRVLTVATRGDSVKLPASVPGLEITIINAAALGIQVYGAGTDTINGIATATGVYQPPGSVDTFWCAATGLWHAEVGFGYSGGLGTESATDTVVAFAGGGQPSATQIVTQMVRITIVATSGDSIKLPASAPGLEITIINHGANPMQVYGLGTDTINDVATATGVSQMQFSTVLYFCTTGGQWYSEGLASGFVNGLPTVSAINNLTATASGTQGTSLVMSSVINRVTTVVTIGDAVRLPAAATGLQQTITNASANSMGVFPASGDAINGAGANVVYALAGGKTASFTSAGPTFWHAVLSA